MRLKTNIHQTTSTISQVQITQTQILLALLGLFFLNLLLRVFYLRYDFVNGDEGVRALTAVRMLEGARLYADVVTDKPPGASLFYAVVFILFGRSMKAVHLAATVWNFGTSLVVYRIAARFYSRWIGLCAALLFIYFSTNYFTQDMMAANTELLMALPYSLAFYVFTRVRSEEATGESISNLARTTGLICAGVLTGSAALFKQIGVLNLLFFFLCEVLAMWMTIRTSLDGKRQSLIEITRAVLRLSFIALGFIVVIVAFVVWLTSMEAFFDFWRNGVVLNMFYIDSEPPGLWLKFMLGRGLGYVFFNSVLWWLAGWAVWQSLRGLRKKSNETILGSKDKEHPIFDLVVALWGAVSLIGVVLSGRFYGHYFIPSLPAFSILGARGSQLLVQGLRSPAQRVSARVMIAIMSFLFLAGLLRCHHRTAVLAYETLTGHRTHWSADWGMTKREEEADIVSNFVLERVPRGAPLYIWGYAHDVFWRTGCRPACRYLTPYYIDGRFSDAEATVPEAGEQFRREAASNLLEDLRRNKPPLILDIEGGLKSLPYEDLVGYISTYYHDIGSAGIEPARPFRALRLREEHEK
jgi:4-amino-4-deoxy-L-arabinose transferase-like glycosyltransferase